MRWSLLGGAALTVVMATGAQADVFEDAKTCHALVEDGRFTRAIDVCSTALEPKLLSSENQAVTLNNRGRAYLRLDDMGRAAADFTAAIELAPHLAHPYSNRAAVHANLGKDAAALDDLDAALERDTAFFAARFNRAILRQSVGDNFAALEDITIVLEAQPDFAPALQARGAMLAAAGLPGVGLVTADTPAAPSAQPTINVHPDARPKMPNDADRASEAKTKDEVEEAVLSTPAPIAPAPQGLEVAPAEPEEAATAIQPTTWEYAAIAGAKTAGAAAEATPSDDFAAAPAPVSTPEPAPTPEAPVRAAATAPVVETAPQSEAPVLATADAQPTTPHRTLDDFHRGFRDGTLRVRDIQQALSDLGYRPGIVDGIYGRRTRGAILACIADRCPVAYD